MYATVRKYKGVPGVTDQIVNRRKDVEAEIKKAPGFNAYYMLKTGDGMTTVTICDTQAGAEASNRLAADWIKKNLPQIATNAPEIIAGDVVVNFSSQKAHV